MPGQPIYENGSGETMPMRHEHSRMRRSILWRDVLLSQSRFLASWPDHIFTSFRTSEHFILWSNVTVLHWVGFWVQPRRNTKRSSHNPQGKTIQIDVLGNFKLMGGVSFESISYPQHSRQKIVAVPTWLLRLKEPTKCPVVCSENQDYCYVPNFDPKGNWIDTKAGRRSWRYPLIFQQAPFGKKRQVK